jgi:hypothetical protein
MRGKERRGKSRRGKKRGGKIVENENKIEGV